MAEFAGVTFAICIAYGAIGNAVVLLILRRRKMPLRLIWSGTPFYLYGVCNRSSPPVGKVLTGVALSTNIALLAAIPALIWMQVSTP